LNKSTRLFTVLAILTLLTFLPALRNGFVNRDDGLLLLENPLVLELSWRSLARIFMSVQQFFYYVPLVYVTIALQHHKNGCDPFVYHLTNLLLHTANVLLVFGILKSLVKDPWQAFIIALIFAVHPLRVESVAWVSERKDVLFSLFFLGSLWSYMRSGKSVPIVLYAAALLSKPTAVGLPLILIVYDRITGQTLKGSLRSKGWYFILAAASVGIGLLNSSGWDAMRESVRFNGLRMTGFNPLHMTDALLFYVLKFYWPAALSPVYPFPGEPGALVHCPWFVSPLFLAAAAAAMWRARKKHPDLFFGAVFFLITMAPSLYFSLLGYVNDRYTYLPSIGLALITVRSLLRVPQAAGHKAVYALLAVVCLGCAMRSWERCGVWKDSVSLWSDAIQYEPAYPFPYNGRGVSYMEISENEKALADFRRAIRLNPAFVMPYLNRAKLYEAMGRHEEAERDLKAAAALTRS
jgi:tetratricopeptide (TPR) repeat protein